MRRLSVSGDGDTLAVGAGGPLRGELRVPGDKSISHRALLLAALADGDSSISGLSDGADVGATAAAVRALGAVVETCGEDVRVRGGELREPPGPLDVGNSGTTIRLLAGIAAGCPFTTILAGDASVNRRPMDRISEPLRLMGADVQGVDGGRRAPLRITGGALRGISWQPPVASAQVKGAVLLAGLFAGGETVVREPVPTRAHTEEMLEAFGADVRVAGGEVAVRASRPAPFDFAVPGDPSAAAFWLVGAALVPGSEVTVHDTYQGRARDGYLRVLRRMGADVTVTPTGERRVRLVCRSGSLRGVTVTAPEIPDLIDEIPVLAVAAATAEGPTRFEGVGELRHKESDRLRSVLGGLAAIGAGAEVDGDTLVVHGGGATARRARRRGRRSPHRHGLLHRRPRRGGWGRDRRRGMALGRHELSRIRRGPAEVPGGVRTPVRVAIDGPGGAGKTSVARAVGERLGVECLDTGAMYRAVAAAVLHRRLDPGDGDAVAAVAREVVGTIEVTEEAVRLEGLDVTEEIRGEAVTASVSAVAANPAVREAMVECQQRWAAERGGCVMEGRDITTVVLPDAEVRVYLTADAVTRARRRSGESGGSEAAVRAALSERDHRDSTRSHAPLPLPDDLPTGVRVIDTTHRDVSDVVAEIMAMIEGGAWSA